MKRSAPAVGRWGYPQLNDEYLESLITHEDYHHFPQTGVTVCCLVVKNGYSVTDEAVCANVATFDPDVGKRRARRNALNELLRMEHYLLRQRIYEDSLKQAGASDGHTPY